MAKTTEFLLPEERIYTRSDYTALRAFCMRIPLDRIAALYYCDDSEQVLNGLERFLLDMRDCLIERSIANNPSLAESLRNARQTGQLSARSISILVQAADLPKPVPSPAQKTSEWFRPQTVRMLKDEGIETLADLTRHIAERGPGWWRPIPRIGPGRAKVISEWLRKHATQLGDLPTLPEEVKRRHAVVQFDPAKPIVAPMGSFFLPPELDGRWGVNRASHFCFISAKDDMAAIECYLAKFYNQPHTLRAYRRELERFILWASIIAKKPLSSLLVDDCEAYKRFLSNPTEAFRGPKKPRSSKLWKPFSNETLQPASIKYALQLLRAAFDYLVKVRYLGGNPWVAVNDPAVAIGVNEIQIEKALSAEGWESLTDALTRRAEVEANVQDRIALATILLLGDSGLRRNEAATALRSKLAPSGFERGIWMLNVLGKRNKWRLVPVSPRTLAALRAHWNDLGLDFNDPRESPLLSPAIIPKTEASQEKHQGKQQQGYRPDSLFKVVRAALARVCKDLEALSADGVIVDISLEDIEQFRRTTPHAFRHTFGTQAVANNMPVTVVQSVMGHTDSATTAIYVREKEKRIAQEAAKYFEKLK